MPQNTKNKKRKEIRILNPSEELLRALEKRAVEENRTITNLAETLLNIVLKVKPKL